MKVLLTGAGGFVGQALQPVLEEADFKVMPVLRDRGLRSGEETTEVFVRKNIAGNTDWEGELKDIDVVIHLAAKVHEMSADASGQVANYREINVGGTKSLAREAAQSGVKRFVYLSSIKVNGEFTGSGSFSADQNPKPEGAYATSKMEAEAALREIEKKTGMEVVIIRPPLVYGPKVKGNLAALIRGIEKGIPLPLAAVNNRRDLVSIYNLCDLIRECCTHPAAPGNVFLVADGESISTPQLIRHLASGLGREARLFSVPVGGLKLMARLLGKSETLERLVGDLQIDISMTQRVLRWSPPTTVAESFRRMFANG